MLFENKDPWTFEGSPWKTKSAFFTWLRGCIRREVWDKYPLKHTFKNNLCKPPPQDYVGRAKSGAICALTKEWTAKSYLEVDHIIGNASFKDWEDVVPFIQHLCTSMDNMQLVNKEAHKIKSYAEKEKITFEEALFTKKAIALINSKKDKDFFTTRGLNIPASREKRRAAIIEVLKAESLNTN